MRKAEGSSLGCLTNIEGMIEIEKSWVDGKTSSWRFNKEWYICVVSKYLLINHLFVLKGGNVMSEWRKLADSTLTKSLKLTHQYHLSHGEMHR